MSTRARLMAWIKLWVSWVTIVILGSDSIVQLVALGKTFGPKVVQRFSSFPPKRVYKNNGCLMVSSNGGLNRMRVGNCDMVAIARYMNVTLIVLELDKTSFGNDYSELKDIFNVDYFINFLRDEVRIQEEVHLALKRVTDWMIYHSMSPDSWSNMTYYLKKAKDLPQIEEHEILHLTITDARLANNGLPDVEQITKP